MKVCFFGMYNKYDASEYVRSPRDEIIIKGLRRNGVQVGECNFPVPKHKVEANGVASFVLARAILFFKEWLGYFKISFEFFAKKCWSADAIIVGFPWKFDVFIAFLLSKIFRKPLVFDMFNSMFETDVLDRKVIKPESFQAKYFRFLDRVACSVADMVLMDTDAHKDFLSQTFGINKKKLRRIFVGSDDGFFYPRKKTNNAKKFVVFFSGTVIPLQGVETIFEVALLLKRKTGIEFWLQGPGHYPEWRARLKKSGLKNMVLFDFLKPKECAKKLSKCDVALGIFGKTQKAQRVVPHKAFDAIACAKPLITQVSPAALEVFSHKKNALLVEAGNAKTLAEAILFLKNNKKVREKIALEAYSLFRKRFSPKAIGLETKKILESLVSRKR